MRKTIYKWIFFRILGWKIEGEVAKEIHKCVFIVIPHTSWYDFFIGLFVRGILNIEINFVGKKELFVFPLNYYFKSIGGAPLDRSGNKNLVDSIVEIFNQRKTFRLAIAPEGTRKKVETLRTGFYYVALKAQVPIIPVAFDFEKKTVSIATPFYPTGNIEEDFKVLLKPFQGVMGKHKAQSFVVKEN